MLRKPHHNRELQDITKQKPEIFFIGRVEEADQPILCPVCSEKAKTEEETLPESGSFLKGPFTRYRKRENELYFDLEEKYLTCPECRNEIRVIDFQVLVDKVSAKLPPEKARAFSMKIMDLYDDSRDYAIEVLSILTEDFNSEPWKDGDFLEELEALIQSRGD